MFRKQKKKQGGVYRKGRENEEVENKGKRERVMRERRKVERDKW